MRTPCTYADPLETRTQLQTQKRARALRRRRADARAEAFGRRNKKIPKVGARPRKSAITGDNRSDNQRKTNADRDRTPRARTPRIPHRRLPARRCKPLSLDDRARRRRRWPTRSHRGADSGAGRAAHRAVSLVSAESDAGIVPPIALLSK
jgi:hypothetical protein